MIEIILIIIGFIFLIKGSDILIDGAENIAIGNIIGSNIFNLLLVLGTTSIIQPIKYNNSNNFNIIFLLTITRTIYTAINIKKKKETNRTEGIILLITFIIYNIKILS